MFAIIVKKKIKKVKKKINFRSRLWYHRRHIQAVSECNTGCPKIGCEFKTNKFHRNAKSGTTKDLTIAFARMDVLRPRLNKF